MCFSGYLVTFHHPPPAPVTIAIVPTQSRGGVGNQPGTYQIIGPIIQLYRKIPRSIVSSMVLLLLLLMLQV